MPQGEHIRLWQKRFGRRLDHEERLRKREAREAHVRARKARQLIGIKAKLFAEGRRKEKIQMKKMIRKHGERVAKRQGTEPVLEGAVPAYLLDRAHENRAKVLSTLVKQKKKTRAGKWDVPIPKVDPIAEDEVFKVLRTGKRRSKQWKRVITKATFVGPGFTRKAPKYERFIRPSALRYRHAHVVHPELKSTHMLEIIGVKKNPSSHLYTDLGVMTKGTVIEVNVADLGLVTQSGKIVWGKYAQVTNHPERDGCVNAVLLV
ncbi:Ribosomal protein S8e [Giardia muris]|uniref:Ribosome biogenesis protein NSA2 homolog n=1 Tax=Giardia muris TaxID=5742 RepID=A0A4Z1T706_GIAMU|nr:Ribosomal protein S8e [Giardia muris]|eukprot:TNJ29853.1 Ribosomal protein S8e [Giardia muris]